MKIEKKVWPKYFQAIIEDKKNYELRLADWKCKEGDTLILREWDPKTKNYTGREITKKVKYVAKFKIDNLFWPKEDIEKYGFQIISLG
ncbi:DUF3850 domain-containing protein [Candidatus Parcubacteria bacterium]|nr:DUF3850 domain-containing protein [Candidatus Omnitrophota bacterium]MCG2689358.1 DUF3850 domain-containing protein [Candidatus Parcubacteria bacterium]